MAGLKFNIRVLKASAPEITDMTTTMPKISPSKAPEISPKRMAPIIIGMRDRGGAKFAILNPLAKVCKTIIRAVSMPRPTKCLVLFVIVFIFPPADIPVNLGFARGIHRNRKNSIKSP